MVLKGIVIFIGIFGATGLAVITCMWYLYWNNSTERIRSPYIETTKADYESQYFAGSLKHFFRNKIHVGLTAFYIMLLIVALVIILKTN